MHLDEQHVPWLVKFYQPVFALYDVIVQQMNNLWTVPGLIEGSNCVNRPSSSSRWTDYE
jgi:hypothetical protein